MKWWFRFFVLILAVGLMACESEVEDTTEAEAEGAEATAGEIEVPTDTVWSHTVTIVYNGSSATVTVDADSVTYSVDGGDVTIKSQAKNIQYTASGSGSGSLKIYSDYRYKLTLNSLTLTSSGKPVINNQGKKSLFLTLAGTSTLSDSNGYATETSDKEDQKGAIFSEGQIFILGDGTLNLAGKNKHAIASDDFIMMQSGTLNITAAATDGVHTNDAFQMDGGTLTIKSSDEGIAVDEGGLSISGGSINIKTSGTSAKGIKSYGAITISGGTTVVSATGGSGESGSEGIESKHDITITGGQIVVDSYDDGINAAGQTTGNKLDSAAHITISGGYVYAHALKNDGIDANGNLVITGGVVVAISAGSPEVALDAHESYKLTVSGGVLFTIGGLESGASLTQTCYSAKSWNKSTWYSMTVGNDTYAFLTPSSGGSTLVVSGSSQPTVKSGVTVSSGTEILNGNAYLNASVSNGSSVSLSTYSPSQGGGPGGGGWH
ncbi:MAG: carbohydrate-binding domain-containing protein [Paludibacteraceae bacterium]|nr:carbohydrate-binding domain-containing protein [Paludibacteraceae bacterium]